MAVTGPYIWNGITVPEAYGVISDISGDGTSSWNGMLLLFTSSDAHTNGGMPFAKLPLACDYQDGRDPVGQLEAEAVSQLNGFSSS